MRSSNPLQNGLEAHFPLDSDTPTNTVTGNDASLYGNPTFGASGIVGQAWQFDTNDDPNLPPYDALVSDPLPLNGEEATVAGWVNYNDFKKWGRAPFQVGGGPHATPDRGWDVQWDGTNAVLIGQMWTVTQPQRYNYDGTIPLNPGTWYFVVMVVEGGSYLEDDSYRIHAFNQNGELEASPITGGGSYRLQSDAAPLVMMAGDSDGRYTTGKLDDVWAYSRALTESEVGQLYSQSLQGDGDGGKAKTDDDGDAGDDGAADGGNGKAKMNDGGDGDDTADGGNGKAKQD